jgi:hypothetical protein
MEKSEENFEKCEICSEIEVKIKDIGDPRVGHSRTSRIRSEKNSTLQNNYGTRNENCAA